jgi:hypothetical protein
VLRDDVISRTRCRLKPRLKFNLTVSHPTSRQAQPPEKSPSSTPTPPSYHPPCPPSPPQAHHSRFGPSSWLRIRSYSRPTLRGFHRESGPYKALSYTWGSTTSELRQIVCNGNGFWATANLFAALERFRHTSQIQRMWVDAICIDQGSIPERAQQINLIREVYRKAKKVLIHFYAILILS